MIRPLDIRPDHLEIVKSILGEHLAPEVQVWIFGSRADWLTKDSSDLDIALEGKRELSQELLGILKSSFEDSALPFSVDIVDLNRVGEPFRRVVESQRIPLPIGGNGVKRNVNKKGVSTKSDNNSHTSPSTLPPGWREVALGEFLTLQRGFDLAETKRVPGPYPVIASTGPVGTHHVATVMGPGVVVGRSGSLGGGQFITSDFWPLNTTLWVKDFQGNDVRFCYYLLKSLDLGNYNAGSGVPTLNRNHIHPLQLTVPPLEEQREIAGVLGAFDDKIELNRRMNETLEAMARALFTSWFVDFEPVRAKIDGRWRRGESLPGLPADLWDLFPDRLVPSQLGDIPEGWEVKALGTFGEIITGKTPSTRRPDYYGVDTPFLRIPDMHGKMYALKTELMLSAQGAESQPKKTLPPGSVSVSCIATPGLVVLNHRDIQTNQQINSIVPNNESTGRYLYWACKQLSPDIETGGLGGSVFGNMNKSTFSALLAIHPDLATLGSFDSLVAQFHVAILANEEQTLSLAEQRDALLPRLMSGEVRVVGAIQGSRTQRD